MIRSQCRGFLIKFPLIGTMFECSSANHKSAMLEFLLTLFFSSVPLLAAMIFDYYKTPIILNSITNNIGRGELIIYASSILSPVFYLVLKEPKERRSFPQKIMHIFVFVVIMLFCLLIFTMQRANVNIDQALLLNSSIIIFVISLILYYSATVLNISIMDPAKEMRDEEKDFSSQVREHRQQG
jgi:hypothetical protein